MTAPGEPDRGTAAATVCLAEAYFAAHCDEPVTLAAVCSGIGIGAREVHDAFLEVRGTTPMAALRQERFDRVRLALRSAGPEADTVATIARRWGFRHLGRFSTAYAGRFGEHPAETLQRPHTDGAPA